MAVAIAIVAWTGHRTYADLASTPRGYIDDPTLRTAAYIATVKPTVPIIVVTNRPELQGLVFAKLYFNASRAYAPTATIPHIFTYLGNPAQLLARTPAQIPDPTEDWMLGYNEISLQAWPDVRRAFDQGAIVLYNKEQVSSALWETAVPDNPSHQVAPGLFIVRGPITTPSATVMPPSVSRSKAAIQVVLTLLMLVTIGGGFSWVCTTIGGGSALEAFTLAPALGAGVAVVTGLVLAAIRIVPGSPGGIGLIAAEAACGYAWAVAVGTRSSSAESTRSTSSTP
jgi:hypothetical protein